MQRTALLLLGVACLVSPVTVLAELGKPVLAIEFDLAEENYRQVLEEYPEPEVAHNNLAAVLERQGRQSEAEVHYRRAIALNPGYVAPRNNLGVLFFARGDSKEAEAQFRHAIEIDSSFDKAQRNLAVLLQLRGAEEAPEP